jgi:hypothetical protein
MQLKPQYVRISSEELLQIMQAKTDEELYLLLRVHSKDYTSEAIKAASEEFSHRRLDEPTMCRIMAVAEAAMEEKNVRHEESDPRLVRNAKETAAGGDWSDFGSALTETVKVLGWLFLLGFVGYVIYGGYEWLDSNGWISHREETAITARNDWLAGESKECWSAPLSNDGAALLKKEVGYAISDVSCDDGPVHNMKVTFYGRKVQPEYKVATWRCTRNEVSFLNDNTFTCYQTGGQW